MADPFDISKMGDLFRQAQQMQDRLQSLQEEVGARTVQASAGGGMVTVEMNGKLEVLAVTIEPQVMEDREMVQDLVAAAINEAIRSAQSMMTAEMSKLTGGIKIPGLG